MTTDKAIAQRRKLRTLPVADSEDYLPSLTGKARHKRELWMTEKQRARNAEVSRIDRLVRRLSVDQKEWEQGKRKPTLRPKTILYFPWLTEERGKEIDRRPGLRAISRVWTKSGSEAEKKALRLTDRYLGVVSNAS